MATAMDTHVKFPYKSVVRKIVTRNVILLIPVLVIFKVSVNGGSLLDPIAYPLASCKCFTALIAILEFTSWLLIVQKSQKKVGNLLKSVAVILLFSGVYHLVAILFGAPFLASSAETYHFAMLLTATTILPACCVLGPPSAIWIRNYFLNMSELGVESVVHICSICSLLGAWLGAFPIPLDWDRPWQVWPISCVLGVLGGYCSGLVLSTCHLIYCTRNRKSKLF
ncbi:phosphatidylinositol-glycan biosynthesis class F protein-like [Liolophura sinensis]|uniref:phosphatidylinositol-glycan biosynthesis class F protein-like n=1 Tax=Liolophura sinensis TaxID=3198878 RepID=UPI003158983E